MMMKCCTLCALIQLGIDAAPDVFKLAADNMQVIPSALAKRMQHTQDLISEELEFRMQHPRADDHPEAISTFEELAHQQKWKSFDVLVNKGIFAFMVFGK